MAASCTASVLGHVVKYCRILPNSGGFLPITTQQHVRNSRFVSNNATVREQTGEESQEGIILPFLLPLSPTWCLKFYKRAHITIVIIAPRKTLYWKLPEDPDWLNDQATAGPMGVKLLFILYTSHEAIVIIDATAWCVSNIAEMLTLNAM